MPAGARVGELISGLEEVAGAVLEDFHAVGFSLGGQMVGAIGLATEGRMKRITALDPAGNACTLEFYLCKSCFR